MHFMCIAQQFCLFWNSKQELLLAYQNETYIVQKHIKLCISLIFMQIGLWHIAGQIFICLCEQYKPYRIQYVLVISKVSLTALHSLWNLSESHWWGLVGQNKLQLFSFLHLCSLPFSFLLEFICLLYSMQKCIVKAV